MMETFSERRSAVPMLLALVLAAGCNEIVATGRFHVASDAGLDGAVDAGRDAEADAETDAGLDCAPSARMTYYRDADGDGHGLAADTIDACVLPTGYADVGDDCDDTDLDVHPLATELCDGVDDDCDTVVDEGLLGPIGAPLTLLATGDGCCSATHSEIVAHQTGYLVVTEKTDRTILGRWFNRDGSAFSGAFTVFGADVTGPIRAVLVEPSTGPANVVIAWFDDGMNSIRVSRRPLASGGGTTRDVVTGLGSFYAPEIVLSPIGDGGVVVAWSDPAGDSALHAQAVDVASLELQGAELIANTADGPWARGLVPIDTSPPTVLLASTEVPSGSLGLELVLRRLVLESTGLRLATDASSPSFPSEEAALVQYHRPLPIDQTLLAFSDMGPCGFPFEGGAEGDTIALGACMSLPAAVRQAVYRGGVVSVLYTDGTFEEIPVVPGAEGTPRVDLGIGTADASLAMRGASGMVVFSSLNTRSGRLIGCE